MKNADDMLREIIDIVDVNGDGKIQFEGGGQQETERLKEYQEEKK